MPRFTDRALGRQLAFQFLFSFEFLDMPWEHALAEFWQLEPVALTEAACEDGIPVAAPRMGQSRVNEMKAQEHAESLIRGVCESKEALDERITAALDNWKPERVGRIEWTILRLALYELTECSETPATVVIAEAVHLANSFGDAESPRFVNGLLDRLAGDDAQNAAEHDAP